MSLPRPPISANTPIPNQPFSADEVYYLGGNQGRLPLGNGLYIDPATGAFTDINPNPYIYCVPQFSNLPVTYPPYGCETEVNTAGVTSFENAWNGCSITEMPCVDASEVVNFRYSWAYTDITSFPSLNMGKGENFNFAWCGSNLASFPEKLNLSSGVNFYGAWFNCSNLTSFPGNLDVSSGVDFRAAWLFCHSLTSFPGNLDVSSGTIFVGAWGSCSSLTSFPGDLNVSSGQSFESAWQNCTSLVEFPAALFDDCAATNFNDAWINCALSQQSVDNILVSIDTAGQSNGTLDINGGTSSTPGVAGWAAVASLEAKGWTVSVNGSPSGLVPLDSVTDANTELETPGATEIQFPKNPEPDQEFTDPVTHKKYKWKRARNEKGRFIADDPATPENEAWVWAWLPVS